MPELPEVETVKNGLKNQLEGTKITAVKLSGKNLRYPFPSNYTEQLTGSTITKLDRRAKYLLIHLNTDKTLIFHLGMSGSITFKKASETHDHIEITLQNKKKETLHITFNDPRRFGFSDTIDTHPLQEHKYFKELGLEPLSEEFSSKYLKAQLNHKKTPIKSAIMDNKIVVGVGNIYACESLFTSKINPLEKCCNISSKKYTELVENIKETLKTAISAGGSSLKDHKTAEGTLGYFQHNFTVYGRENEPCNTCSTPISAVKIAGRNTFFCPKCQPLKQ